MYPSISNLSCLREAFISSWRAQFSTGCRVLLLSLICGGNCWLMKMGGSSHFSFLADLRIWLTSSLWPSLAITFLGRLSEGRRLWKRWQLWIKMSSSCSSSLSWNRSFRAFLNLVSSSFSSSGIPEMMMFSCIERHSSFATLSTSLSWSSRKFERMAPCSCDLHSSFSVVLTNDVIAVFIPSSFSDKTSII